MNGLPKLLFDTDTLSLYFRKSPKVVVEAQKYLRQHRVFTFSIITRFEILRGMKSEERDGTIEFFKLFCLQNEVVQLDDNITVRAADIYADLSERGHLIGDADILIAATALENGLPVVTNNESHFSRISNLQILNWSK